MKECGLCGAIHYGSTGCPYAERGIIPDWCDEEHKAKLQIYFALGRYEARDPRARSGR